MSNFLAEINSGFAPNLLMFAWQKFGRPNSVIKAEINSINANQMGLTLHTKKGSSDALYTFSSSDKANHPNPQTPMELTNLIKSILKKNSYPRPPLGATIVGLFLWLLFIVGTIQVSSCPSFLLKFKSYIFFSSTTSKNLLTLMLVLHAMEACYVINNVSPFVRTLKCKFVWAFSTLILGYPVTQQSILLNKLQSTRTDNKKNM